ncbi:MAG: hypothetical protein HYZ42_13090 [Bacteroidetes bacterium]|nr:hypothetical protein [Bacteroidota bacterium]
MRKYVKTFKSKEALETLISKIISKNGKFSVTGLKITYSYPQKKESVLSAKLPTDIVKLVSEGKVTYRGGGMSGKYAGYYRIKVKGYTKEFVVTIDKLLDLEKLGKRTIQFSAPFRKER